MSVFSGAVHQPVLFAVFSVSFFTIKAEANFLNSSSYHFISKKNNAIIIMVQVCVLTISDFFIRIIFNNIFQEEPLK